MSIAAVNWALTFAPVECAQEHIILIALADRAGDDGRCAWPSQEWLAQRGRCSTRTVRRHLKALEARGLIRRGDQRHVAHIRKDCRPVVWDLDITQIQVPAVPTQLPESTSNERPDNLSARTSDSRQDKMSGRSSDAERPDTGVLTDRTLLSYKPSLEPSLTVRSNAPEHEATAPAAITTNNAAAAAEFDQNKNEIDEKSAAAQTPLVQMRLDELANGLVAQGLHASFRKLTDEQRAEISKLVEQHDVPALVKAAQRQYQPDSPARFVQAWLPAWRDLRAPGQTRTTSKSPIASCDRCDQFGWLLGPEKNSIVEPAQRCNHAAVSGAA
ncbi:helix-turn-helix domain-containing protein [Rhodococcus sp. RDE2]|uniref:helix-turn-helix domain-containing protein n=1 Tax=Rhodococcus sp. RDE2 TaxID=2885078 RepID=UPI001E32D4EE|nr:helix-turn-helix domain-containing protein [Rhodococcus sp. RDE2]BDB62332.1 hypothetical protein RDE2_41260 [Rhodococcus sp. RDE2]